MFLLKIGFCPDMTNSVDPQQPSRRSQKVIVCECGAEILLIPDVKQMDRAITNHAEWHAGNEKDPRKANTILEHIQNYLVNQILTAAGKKKPQKQHLARSKQRKKQL